MAMPIVAALNLSVDESAILKAPHPGLQPVTNTNLQTDEHLAEHDQIRDYLSVSHFIKLILTSFVISWSMIRTGILKTGGL
jgi:hypothetical protein